MDFLRTIRPLSVDSLNGGSTDALKKVPVEKKKLVKNFSVISLVLLGPQKGITTQIGVQKVIVGQTVQP